MAFRQKNKLNEGYTEFGGGPESRFGSYFTATGVFGTWLAKFFAKRAQKEVAKQYKDTEGEIVLSKAGDTRSSEDQIKADSPSNGVPSIVKFGLHLPETEVNRRRRYEEFEKMDEYPEIGAAFDIYSDDSCQKNIKGERWHIKSDSITLIEEVKKLFKRIKLDRFYWDITRNVYKYGDCFIEIIVDLNNPEAGIQRIKILNPKYILRQEDKYGYLQAFYQEIPEKDSSPNYTKGDFSNKIKYIPLDKNQIIHLRLHTSDPLYYPYGKSIAALAIRIYRSLKLMEDAMLIYRLARAPERRVFYIDVGTLPATKAEMFIERIKHKFKKEKFYNAGTGQIDARYNPLPIHKDTPIPLLDGRILTIKQLAQEYNNKKENWVYSIQDKTHKIVPGKVTWCGKNYTAKELIKVWLDNNSYIITAPEHPFILRDGNIKIAEHLKINDSLMPLYKDYTNKGYERCYNIATQKYETTHTLVAKDVYPIGKNHKVSKIERLHTSEDVYCMTVVGFNNENDRHNFAALSINKDNTISKSGVFLMNSADEDFYVPVRSGSQATKIDTLRGAENLGEVDDVKYFRDKLLAAMKVPKDYIVEKDKSPERKANLSQLDVKFARAVTRGQHCVEIGLEILVKKHLEIKKFPSSLISGLRIDLPDPSDMFTKRKLEIDEAKARVVAGVIGTGLFPKKQIYKEYYDLTEAEIEEIEKELEEERKKLQEQQGAEQGQPGASPGGAPGAGGGLGQPGSMMDTALQTGGVPQPAEQPKENINIFDKLVEKYGNIEEKVRFNRMKRKL